MEQTLSEGLSADLADDLDDWELLKRFLPAGWESQARTLGAFRRARGFADADALLRTLLIHLAVGCPLREAALRARQGGVASVSSVALWKRLRASGPWLRWLAEGVMERWVERTPGEVFGGLYRVRLVDGTAISEPGSTGSDWRIHYSVELETLECDFVEVSDVAHGGETFTRFPVSPGDLLLGDRVYATRAGIRHVVEGGGHVLTRFSLKNLPLETPEGGAFALLPRLRTLSVGETGEWPARTSPKKKTLAPTGVRVCALKRSQVAAAQARKSIERVAQRKGYKPHPDTVEAAGYVFVVTTAPASSLSAEQSLEVYRGRWQVELAFKRLKSLMELGHLPKKDPDGARAWLHGKLLTAFLVEALIRAGDSFFPWGYPMRTTERGL
jgi:hypothetical protein